MKLIYRLLQEFRLFQKLDRLWYIYRFNRRWRRIYREATPIDGIPNLYISVCDPESRSKLSASFVRVWNRVPAVSKETLQHHWHRLQRTWDRRNTGISLYLPVIGSLDISTMAPDIGAMSAFATMGGFRSGLEVSLDADTSLFASIFLPVLESPKDCSHEALDLAVARQLANYLLWLQNPVPEGRMHLNFVFGWHDATDELVKTWGIEP